VFRCELKETEDYQNLYHYIRVKVECSFAEFSSHARTALHSHRSGEISADRMALLERSMIPESVLCGVNAVDNPHPGQSSKPGNIGAATRC
jgi:hypothetical protein